MYYCLTIQCLVAIQTSIFQIKIPFSIANYLMNNFDLPNSKFERISQL